MPVVFGWAKEFLVVLDEVKKEVKLEIKSLGEIYKYGEELLGQ